MKGRRMEKTVNKGRMSAEWNIVRDKDQGNALFAKVDSCGSDQESWFGTFQARLSTDFNEIC